MWIEREIESTLVQLGATTTGGVADRRSSNWENQFAEKLFPSFGYVSLDLPRLAEEAEKSGSLFLRKISAANDY